MLTLRKPVIAAALLAAALAAPPQAHAQNYPDKPVHIIVGMPAGSFTDLSARWMADELQTALGSTFVVENRPGAGTNIASAAVARATGDGYTLLLATNANTMNTSLFRNLPYDVVKDFEPVAMIASTPFLFVVRPDLPAKNMQELIAYAKANPGKLNVAATGRGTGTHLAIEMLQQKAGIKVQTIFYKGSLESVTDVIAGRIDAMFSPISTAKPHIASGKLRALAITSPDRSALVPDVPTVAEAGVPGYSAAMWTGLFAPAGTPQPVIDRLSAAATKAAGSPALQGKIRNGGGDAIVMGKKDFSAFVREDIARWQAVVKAAGIEPN